MSEQRRFWLMGLACLLIVLGQSIAVQPGNWLGFDEYKLSYSSSFGVGFPLSSRPLHLLPINLTHWLIGMHPLPGRLLITLLRTLNALLFYLLLRRLLPQHSDFAQLGGLIYAAYLPHDMFNLAGYSVQSVVILPVGMALGALLAYFSYLRSQKGAWLALSLLLLAGSTLAYESGLIMVGIVPMLALLPTKERPRHHWIGAALWLLTVLGLGLRFIFAGVLSADSYGARLSVDLAPTSLVLKSALQFAGALTPLFNGRLFPSTVAAPLVGVLAGAAAVVLRPRLSADAGARNESARIAFWSILIGLGLAWLGVLPYLPTDIANVVHRTQFFASAGEALALCGLIWWISMGVESRPAQRAAQTIGLALVAGIISANLAAIQSVYRDNAFTWESHARFRMLAQQAPALLPNTLLYSINASDAPCPPAMSATGYSVALRYLYADQVFAAGREGWAERVNIDESGFEVLPRSALAARYPLYRASSHRWNETVLLSQPDCGGFVILRELPESLLLGQDPALYEPEALILHNRWLPERMVRLLPPVQPVD